MVDAEGHGDAAKKPNIFKRLWQKSGLTFFFILLACKGGLPPTLALAAYESHDWSDIFTTLGYLVAVISHLSLAIQPRAKFFQSLMVSLVFSCMGAAMALLEIRCITSARGPPPPVNPTGGSGAPEAPVYSAAACATAAVFLFFYVFVANCLKSARPQMTLPIIQFVIFVVVASVYAPSFPNMTAGMSFIRRLLLCFLTGYALATAVSVFVLPVTSRGTVTKQLCGFTKLLKGCIASHGTYMTAVHNAADSVKGQATEEEVKASKTLKGLLIKSNELLGKIKLEIGFARKEFAFGKLSPHHFSDIYNLVRKIYSPVLGMSSFLEIVTTLREHRAVFAEDPQVKEAMEAARKLESEEWDDVIAISHEAYVGYQSALFLGLQHVAYQLELEPRPKVKDQADVEKAGPETPQPGDKEFARHLGSELRKYERQRIAIIQEWASQKELSLPKHFWRNTTDQPTLHRQTTTIVRERLNQHQLYMILYLNFLNFSVGKAILNLAQYADGLVADGTMTNRRIINPGFRRIRKLFMDAVTQSDADETLSSSVNGGSNIYFSDALKTPKDPEHLPPANIYERATNLLRKLPAFLQSHHACFGFRAATATISVAIIGYLRQTRPFFLEQRGLWALIMVAISMDPYAGQGIFGFVARIGGTVLAMVVSIVIWYMCDHKHAGIIVVFWVWCSICMLFIIKFPQFAVVGIISSITVVLVVGYELQVEVIGRQLATSNGQEFFPVELLAVYRLAAVCAGLGVAFLFTYFPYPITTHGALRRGTGNTLYTLANFYSIVHSTLDARLHLGPAINRLPANHPVRELDSARDKVFGKVLLMLNNLRTHGSFTRFEPVFGGKFPRQRYLDLTNSIQNVFMYLALMVYSSRAFVDSSSDRDYLGEEGVDKIDGADAANGTSNGITSPTKYPDGPAVGPGLNHQKPTRPDAADSGDEEEENEDVWLTRFRAFIADSRQRVTSHEVTTTLVLLSNAIREGQPLPPHLRPPRPFAQKWALLKQAGQDAAVADSKNDPDAGPGEEPLLGIEHLAHPAYAAFAVGEVASAFVTAELGKIVKIVKELVGEVDFSFHVQPGSSSRTLVEGEDEKWWEVLGGEFEDGEKTTKMKRKGD